MQSSEKELLISQIDKLHTTPMGVERIKRNLSLETDDVVKWCENQIQCEESEVIRKGKNWYVDTKICTITVNVYSYTIITAHKKK